MACTKNYYCYCNFEFVINKPSSAKFILVQHVPQAESSGIIAAHFTCHMPSQQCKAVNCDKSTDDKQWKSPTILHHFLMHQMTSESWNNKWRAQMNCALVTLTRLMNVTVTNRHTVFVEQTKRMLSSSWLTNFSYKWQTLSAEGTK